MNNRQIIKTDKFITDYAFIGRVIPFDFLKENPSLANIYCALILKSLPSINSSKAFHDFLEENYGANMNYRISIFDKAVYLGIRIECLSKEYLLDNYDAFSKLIDISLEAFFLDPIFDEQMVEKNKKELVTYIRNQDKSPYSICFKKVYRQLEKDHPLIFNSLGSIEKANEVDITKLLEFHNQLKKYPITYIYQGNNKYNQFELLKEKFKDDFSLPIYQDVPFKEHDYVYGEEEFASTNTILMMVYHFNLNYSLRNNILLRFFDRILGGENSILFNEIREKRGLCYSIQSTAYTSENVLEISTKISKNTIQYSIDSIKEIVSNFESYCSLEYFEKAKMDLVSELIERIDNPSSTFSHNLIILYKRNRIDNYEENIALINDIKYEEIIEFSKGLKPVSTYVVKGGLEDGSV